ncbi:MAG TPA: ATPase, T2SS/T4P/T4SS family [Candidatus Humimicrobiaceae bacterium]|nr:ATPase, T2SS/T4P/T4SS family [Candidatus Humimicrobiaceae bacterium]
MLISEKELEKILVDSGRIEKVDFDMVKALSKEIGQPLDRMLIERGLIKDEEMGKVIAKAAGYPFTKLKKAIIDEITPQLLAYIPESVAQSQRAIVFAEEEEVLKVATTDPGNYTFLNLLGKKSGKQIKTFYVTDFDIEQALKKYKGDITKEVEKLIEGLKKNPKKSEENIVTLVDLLLDYGYTALASDVHIEPLARISVVRYRISGSLFKIIEYPREFHIRVVSRIKILARLRTDERARAQDGRFEQNIRGAKIDFRVSIMPTTEGENVVIRILMQRGRRFELPDLGLLESDFKKVKSHAEKPYGMILVVGPTGSGKTTTLYALIQLINKPDVNITTIEDPVEYSIERVRQIQVNPVKDITFPKGLRSIVRQDPDIIMVGEIRDKETVDIAINSAMTGHLVLSTLHANDAPTTFSRFLEMGAKAHLVATCVNVVIAQRLVRKICQECKEGYFLSGEELELVNNDPLLVENLKRISGKENISKIKFYKGKGCKFCNHSGYEERTGVFEVLDVTEEIRELVTKQASMDAIRKKAMEQGMTTMICDGITKALMGITTLHEVRRVAKV